MNFTKDIVIGLEIHAELGTKTKLFCSCATKGNEEPNTRTCPICLGHPGSKPVVNYSAVKFAVMLAKALECRLAQKLIFSRKSYFYPDLAKNYQITQYEDPIGKNGYMNIGKKKIGISRVHLEEDPASIIHPLGIEKSPYTLVDYNRSGNPLCEIVTEPEIDSPAQARDFMKSLLTMMQYLGIYEDGSIIKADANISLKEKNYVRVEIKNISGFKEIERALNYEILRQKKEDVKQETRLWDATKGITRSLRSKESEDDYGYIFEPDIVPVEIDADVNIPQLPHDKLEQYKKLGLSEEDALVISNDFTLMNIFERVGKKVDPVLSSRWIRRELVRVAGYNEKDPDEIDVPEFIKLLELIEKKKITEKVGQKIMEELGSKKIDVLEYVKKNDLESTENSSDTEKFCSEAICENPKAVEDLKAGKEAALNFLLGCVMKKSRGKIDASEAREALIRNLK
jgi:aspartyl-tRNA(Asn)/glutamyl-tRNA(Gln) amidotransferase subunit B